MGIESQRAHACESKSKSLFALLIINVENYVCMVDMYIIHCMLVYTLPYIEKAALRCTLACKTAHSTRTLYARIQCSKESRWIFYIEKIRNKKKTRLRSPISKSFVRAAVYILSLTLCLSSFSSSYIFTEASIVRLKAPKELDSLRGPIAPINLNCGLIIPSYFSLRLKSTRQRRRRTTELRPS